VAQDFDQHEAEAVTTSKVCTHCGALIEQHDWYIHQMVHLPEIAQHHQDWCSDPNCEWKDED
jgi:hypothetical protein